MNAPHCNRHAVYSPSCKDCQREYHESQFAATGTFGAPSSAPEAALQGQEELPFDVSDVATADTDRDPVEPNREASPEVCQDCGEVHPMNEVGELATASERAEYLVQATLAINDIPNVSGEYALLNLAFRSMKEAGKLTREEATERMMFIFNGVYGDTN